MDNVKGLIAKCWKNELLDLEPGTHHVDEFVTLHVSGSIVKQNDLMVSPTASLPLIPILALFWEKSGFHRDKALAILREAITEAMKDGKGKSERIESKMKDVESAVKAVKSGLISQLPKVSRSGRVVTKNLCIEVVTDNALTPSGA